MARTASDCDDGYETNPATAKTDIRVSIGQVEDSLRALSGSPQEPTLRVIYQALHNTRERTARAVDRLSDEEKHTASLWVMNAHLLVSNEMPDPSRYEDHDPEDLKDMWLSAEGNLEGALSHLQGALEALA